MRKFSMILLVWMLLCSTTVAQLPDFSFRHYTPENGFPSWEISQITQDKYGFIWCLANTALTRYDGAVFRIYRHDEEDSHSLPASKFYKIGKSSNGLLLIAYQKGICYYDYTIDGFKTINLEVLAKSNISGALVGKDNDIWFATQDKVLHRFDTKTGKTESFAACKSNITALCIDSRNILWVGTLDGLYRFYPQQNKYELYWKDTIHKIYGAGMVISITEDEKKTIWFNGYNSGLYSMNISTREIRFFDFKPLHWRKSDFFSLTNLVTCKLKGQDYILTGSADGLVFLNIATGNYFLVKHDPGNQGSLPSNNVYWVFYDNTGTLWAATKEGLSKIERSLPQFKTVHLLLLKDKDAAKEEEPNTEINVICQDNHDNTIWIGTDSMGLLHYDLLKDSLVKQISIRNNNGSTVRISRLYMDKADRLWLGTAEGVCVYEPATDKTIFLNQEKGGKDLFAKNEVSSDFMEDGRNNIWVGTVNGISIYDSRLLFIENLKEEKDKPGTLRGQHIFALYPKNKHQVWVATKTLNLYDLDSNSFVINISKNYISNLSPSFIYEITDDGKGNFYFTSIVNIYFSPKGSDSFYFPPFNASLNQNLSKSFVDSKGLLWVTAIASGLLKIDPATNTITRFTVRNGLASNRLVNAWQSHQNGPIFLVMQDGFQYFYPDSVKTDTIKPPLRITGISILEKPLKADYVLFADSILTISYKQNVITFEFALLDYSFTEDITYQYKLDDFDGDWIDAGNRHSVTYTNLYAGNYNFRVRAKNHDNVDMGQAIVKLRVVPPFWKTGWFITLIAICLLFALYCWYRYLLQKYRTEKIVNFFTASLYGQTTIEDMAWDIARNCISKLGFVDCVVYILDIEKKVLVQKAACGPKNPVQREILSPIEILLGKGIVGSVAQSGIAEIINDTSADKRYIVDDVVRFSEISVPMVTDEIVYGVIDSEHPKKNFYTKQHLYLLKKIASICSVRISKYITEDRLRTKIARDLHDELGSTLTSINIISKMALLQANGNDIMSNNFQKIKDHSGYMMESMSDIVWAINPVNDTLEKIILRMKEFAAEIAETAKINYYFHEEGLLDTIKLNLEQRKDIYLIFKEALNNAVKYSGASGIFIILRGDHRYLRMEITDNGIGFDVEKTNPGNGLRNIQSRARQMQAECEIRSVLGTGSTIMIQVTIP